VPEKALMVEEDCRIKSPMPTVCFKNRRINLTAVK
jgi:hypothetical protein